MSPRVASIAVGSAATALCIGVSAQNCFAGPQSVIKEKPTAQPAQGSSATVSVAPQPVTDTPTPVDDFNRNLGIMQLLVSASGLVCLYGGVLHRKTSKRAELRRGRTCMRAVSVLTQDNQGRDRFMEAASSVAIDLTETLSTKELVRNPEVSELDFFLSSQPGVCAPYGIPGVSVWDPLGLCTTEDKFRTFRQAEIKHGRVAMLANIGLVAQHEWRFNFDYPYTGELDLGKDIPSGFEAIFAPGASGYFGALVIIAGIHEVCFKDDDKEPGNFGDPFGFGNAWFTGGLPDAQLKNFRTTEINNGRLAMFGVIGSLLAENATGMDAVTQWQYAGAAWQRTLEITWFPTHAVGPLLQFVN